MQTNSRRSRKRRSKGVSCCHTLDHSAKYWQSFISTVIRHQAVLVGSAKTITVPARLSAPDKQRSRPYGMRRERLPVKWTITYRELAGWSNDNERYGDSTYSYCYSCRSAIGRHRENWTYGGYTNVLFFGFPGGASEERRGLGVRGEVRFAVERAYRAPNYLG